MMPPMCRMCGKNHRKNPDEKFKLIYFKLTPEQAEAKARMKERRKIGHPPGAHWFCARHAAQIAPFKDLTYSEAKARMRKSKGVLSRIKSWMRLT